MKRCPVCSTQYPDEQNFCLNDGTRLVPAADAPPASTTFSARLAVQTPDGRVQEVTLGADTVGIGKSAENAVALADPAVSRNHATVRRQDGQYVIYDAGSRNGVFVNGQRVGPEGQALRQGDVITLGQSRLTFSVVPVAAQPPGPSATLQPPNTFPTPQTTSPGSPPSQTPQPTRALARLDVTLPSGQTMQVRLFDPEASIGKGNDNTVVLADPAVSRNHAAVRRQNGQWQIFDAGSRNGVFVNGQRVGPEGRVLQPGDTISIGQSRINLTPEPAVRIGTPAADTPRPTPPVPPPTPPPTAPPAFTPLSTASGRSSAPPAIQVAASGELTATGSERVTQKIVLDDRYELEAKLAQGTTGTIYRARRVLLGDRVAVRVLRPELVRDPMALERFRRQAQVAARIKHPNSVQIIDFGTTSEGVVYIVEELLSGRTLRDVVLKERGLTLSRVVGIFNQICGAVHAAHLNGIVLRNIRPESIFVEVGADGKELIKVGGYGLAKVDPSISGGMTMAAQAKILGSPQYMSPEQLLDQPLDSRSDVYSLGVILFELLTGSVPFDSLIPSEVAQMHLNAPIPDVSDFGRRDLDEGVAAVVTRALSKDANRRQPTALHLAAELQAVSGAAGGLMGALINKATGLLTVPPVVVPQGPAAAPAGEAVLPSVVAEPEAKGRGAFNATVLALMAEAFFSRISSGLIKTAVPLYALLVFGMNITSVMLLVLVQNIVPLLLRPVFGTMADKYGKKRIFMLSLVIRTAVTVLFAFATQRYILYAISVMRGIADSAKGPSASAMIADQTDERHIAQAYSWYTTTKSTSGGIGESIAAFMLVGLIVFFVGRQQVTANVAVLEQTNRQGANVEEILRAPEDVVDNALPGAEPNAAPRPVLRVEQREILVRDVPIDDLPKVVDQLQLRRALVAIFIAAAFFSGISLILVQIFIKEKKKDKSKDKEKKEKKEKVKAAKAGAAGGPTPTGLLHMPQQQPNVWAFALLGTALTAPAYMVTGEFFTILAVKLEVTPAALGWIKIGAETITPLIFGPVFGWLADRIGSGKVVALRSIANMLTSLLFWITPWFAGTALLGLAMGLARGVDEIGKAAFKPTWGAIAAKVSSFNLANRGRTMGIMEGGIDAADLVFPQLAGLLLQYLSLGFLMAIRAGLALVAEVYAMVLMRKYKI